MTPRTSSAAPRSNRRAKPGPKPRLSREAIIAEACALLSSNTGDFTMAKLAQNLGAGVMSLYRYFPNRDDLLDAVAAHLVELWDPPQVGGRPWQDVVLDWLRETQRLWDEYPDALRVVFWNSRRAGSWIEVWMVPLARALKDSGFSEERIAFGLTWLGTSAIGVIVTEPNYPGRTPAEPIFSAKLPDREKELINGVITRMRDIDRDLLREFSLKNIVSGLETLLGSTQGLS